MQSKTTPGSAKRTLTSGIARALLLPLGGIVLTAPIGAQATQQVLQWGVAGQGSPVVRIVSGPAGYMASADGRGHLKVWQGSAGAFVGFIDPDWGDVQDITISGGGALRAVGMDGILGGWSVLDGTPRVPISVTDATFRSVAASANDSYTAVGSDDGKIRVYSPSGQLTVEWVAHAGAVLGLRYSPDNALLASAGDDDLVKIWTAGSNPAQLRAQCVGHTGDVCAVAFNATSTRVASASADTTVRIWNVTNGSQVFSLTGHSQPVTSIAFTPDGTKLCSGSMDASIRTWDAVTGGLVANFGGAEKIPVQAVALTADGQQVVVARLTGEVESWNPIAGTFIRAQDGARGGISRVVFAPSGLRCAASSLDGKVYLRNANTGRIQLVVPNPRMTDPPVPFLSDLAPVGANPVSDARFTSNSQQMVTGSWDGIVRLINCSDGTLVRSFTGHTDAVFSVAISSDDKTLASAGNDCSIKVCRVSDATVLYTLVGHSRPIQCLALRAESVPNPSGQAVTPLAQPQSVYSGSDDGTVRRWRNGLELWSYPVQGTQISCLALSPDGLQLAVGYSDNKVRILDATSGSLVREIVGSGGPILAIDYSRDGTMLTASSKDNAVRTWNPANGSILRTDSRPWAANVVTLAYSAGPPVQLAYGHRDGTVMTFIFQ